MTRILLILSSPREGSLSTRFARELADGLTRRNTGATLVVRDLGATPLPHVDEAYIAGRMLAPEARSPAQAHAVGIAETLISEVAAADIVVIGSAMINFAATTQLKAWFDYIVWPGVTFSYENNSVVGKLSGKKTYLVSASGGIYSQGASASFDFQTPHLLHLLGFIGLTDVEQVRVEGIAHGTEGFERAVASANEAVLSAIAKAA